MQSTSAAKNYANDFQEASAAQSPQQQKGDEEDVSAGKYGTYGLIQSGEVKDIKFTELKNIDESMHGQDVWWLFCLSVFWLEFQIWVRGRIHAIRAKGKTCFIVLRSGVYTLQVIFIVRKHTNLIVFQIGVFVTEKVSKAMLKFVSAISRESIVDIQGTVQKVDAPVESCTQKTVEVHAFEVNMLSR